MGRMRTATVALLLCTSVLVVGHGDTNGNMDMGHTSHSVNTTNPLDPFAYLYEEPNYASLAAYSGWMMAHIGLMTLAWFFTLPVAVMLSIARSNLALPTQIVFLAINGLGVLASTIYNVNTPNLYEHNKHHAIGWVATWTVAAQVAMSLLFAYAGRRKPVLLLRSSEQVAFLPHTLQSLDDRTFPCKHSWSSDSGQGTEPPSPGRSHESSAHQDFPFPEVEQVEEPEDVDQLTDIPLLSTQKVSRWRVMPKLNRLLSSCMSRYANSRVTNAAEIVYEVIDRVILILGFVAFVTGGVTYSGIFRSNNIFNGLAHFVKGGIFFWYGILTLGRWMGSFADLGWAWNRRPSKSLVGWKSHIPTAEFAESFVIWLYGCTNVFLEHLAAWGGAWSAQDFEHVSISILFFGGGLAGMLVESRRIRRWLNTEIDTISMSMDHGRSEPGESREAGPSSATSLNIMPALTILLLGIMMSSHHQASVVSTKVHAMWGTLLVGFAICRGLTYMLNYVSPPQSIYPSRPPTELAASFCLIAGGLVFMLSTKDVIHYMEEWGLMSMFIFTVVVGFTAFLMAYQILVTGVKGWAIRRARRPTRPARHG